ncbi:MAG: hypothetical protein L0Z53_21240 [Acidobacteriales bacterium]|nr:hypothetical protein [Terriglobales bacterium]
MMERICFRRLSGLALAAGLLALAGCGAGNSSAQPPAADYGKVRSMTGFYDAYLAAHRGQPPPSEQAIREYLNSKQDNLQKAGLTVDEVFVSPRNAKSLQWVYGRKPPLLRQQGMTGYAYEAEAVDGKRLVIGGRGMFVEIDETQFRALFPKTP